ncbi:MAG: thiosulfate oxidation carrier protein SoxY [Gammaproteobacteria bacterium]|nr:thiosulfate oxidation carrier protein SoxY [Gammaproteobacteria bacterium]
MNLLRLLAPSWQRPGRARSCTRRRLLTLLAGAPLAALVTRVRAALSAARPVDAFAARDLHSAVRTLYGGRSPVPSAAIVIDTVDIAEDGSIVPVEVSTSVAGVRSIALFAERNPAPLIGIFRLDPALEPYLATRIKLGESGDLLAVVETDTALLVARRPVRVVLGGCA